MYLTIKQVAERLQVSPPTVAKLRDRGELVCYKFGRHYRIDEADFKAYLAQSRCKPVDPTQKLPLQYVRRIPKQARVKGYVYKPGSKVV
ncbi:hypothetical protein FACS18949_08900 [Clostridia bacterium]|nr:hypothetical protein FACS18949_08900 [Clostridia bacterium]